MGNRAPPNAPYSYIGAWWAFQADLLPYMESKDVYKLCNFSYSGDCFDWIRNQPPTANSAESKGTRIAVGAKRSLIRLPSSFSRTVCSP